MKPKKSITRFQYREAEKKILPAVKLLSQYMHNTAPDAPKDDFHGYSVSAGTFKDGHGIPWQLQVKAVCTKSQFLRGGEITPLIRKGAWLFKLRVFSKTLIDKIFA